VASLSVARIRVTFAHNQRSESAAQSFEIDGTGIAFINLHSGLTYSRLLEFV
jgi:hypothetical protein